MYQRLKSVLKKIVPEKWLRKNELWLRFIYARYFFKRGDCACTVCGQSLARFLEIEKGELLCPACGSGKRHRRLFVLLKEKCLKKEAISILDFSPNKGFEHYARNFFGKAYLTTNFDSEDDTDFHYDITQIEAADKSYDVIICYHVLEHIPQDQKAMAELLRILKPGGICFIQTPFKKGEIYEDATITSPEERLKHFEQEDHVRIYSVKGLSERLQNTGFETKILHYRQKDRPEETKKYGFKDNEYILFVKRPE